MPVGKKSVGIEPDIWRILHQRKLDTGTDVYEQIRDLVLASEGNPPPTKRNDPGDEGDNLCSMVRSLIAAGQPWSVAIRGLVISLYEKMLRET